MTYLEKVAQGLQSELRKIAQAKMAAASSGRGKYIAPMLAGALGLHYLRQAADDRKVGAQLRAQQGQ